MISRGILALFVVVIAIIILIASGFVKNLVLGVAGFGLFAIVVFYLAYIAFYRKLPFM